MRKWRGEPGHWDMPLEEDASHSPRACIRCNVRAELCPLFGEREGPNHRAIVLVEEGVNPIQWNPHLPGVHEVAWEFRFC